MKNIILAAMLLAGTTASAIKPTDQVTLTMSEYGPYGQVARYSFRNLTSEITSSIRWRSDLFMAIDNEGKDYFRANHIADQFNFIFDIGERSCRYIPSRYPENRLTDPLGWLAYSDSNPNVLPATAEAEVKVGHCYLVYNNDADGRVVALFHIKKHIPNKSIVIDEVEVLDGLLVSDTNKKN